ncbi:MAG: hypothetical protein RSB95_04745 [Bacilli bacterium]
MKKIFKLLLSVLTVGLIGATSSCMGEETDPVQTLECSSGNIATYGTQDVVLNFKAPAFEGDTTNEISTFKSTITAKDISFKFTLIGREVSTLKYLTPSTITLTLEGDSRKSVTPGQDLGMIVVSGKAIENGIPSFCSVTVKDPYLKHKSVGTSKGFDGKYTYTTEFEIIGGKFTKPFVSEYVELVDKTNGVLTTQVLEENVEGMLLTTIQVVVSKYTIGTINQPSVKFGAASNSLGLSYTEKVGTIPLVI